LSIVVKLQLVTAASATPSEDVAVLSTFAVYDVEPTSGDDGVSFAVSVAGSYDTVAGTAVPPADSVKLWAVIVDAFIARESFTVDALIVDASMPRENVARTVVSTATPVAPDAGDAVVTVGGGCEPSGTTSASTK